jgi:hypothetical protein
MNNQFDNIISISHLKYSEIILNDKEFRSLTTSELDDLMGIKYKFTYTDENEERWYDFDVLDRKKLMLFRIKYGF